MPNFLEDIFAQLKKADSRVVLREIHGEKFVSVSGRELLEQVQRVRAHLRRAGLQPGERCALLAPNSARWVAFNLALLAEGVIVVPLYARQAPVELAAMMKDCLPRFLFSSDLALGEAVAKALPPQWSNARRLVLFDDVLQEPASDGVVVPEGPNSRADADLGDYHLYVGYIWRAQRCLSERWQRDAHHFLRTRAIRSAHGGNA